jgi:hypothetical protein
MTIYDYDKFVHPVPSGHTIPKGTPTRRADLAPNPPMETFFTMPGDFVVPSSHLTTYYLTYDITAPKLPEEINSVIYNVRAGEDVFPVAVYQGGRIWSMFSDLGDRSSIYTSEIESFDLTPSKEESGDDNE